MKSAIREVWSRVAANGECNKESVVWSGSQGRVQKGTCGLEWQPMESAIREVWSRVAANGECNKGSVV
jgi:hypothetical protein